MMRVITALLRNRDLPRDLGKTVVGSPGLGGDQDGPRNGVLGVCYSGAGRAPRSHRFRRQDPGRMKSSVGSEEVLSQQEPPLKISSGRRK